MLKRMKRIALMACSLLASAAVVGGVCTMPAAQSVTAEEPAASFVSVDTETKSAWESAGYGTDGYIILGSNIDKAKLGYSNMYTEYGNDGKTEISWYRHGNSEIYYEEYEKGVDSTAPIGKWAWLGQTWSRFNTTGTFSGRNSYLYAPGTTTEYGWRLHNTNDSPNRDTGFSFELRDVGSINATIYVTDAQSEWNKVDYTANPITVSLYKTKSLFVTTANDSNKAENVTRALEDYYGTPVAETTVTTNNVYVTFELNEPGVYTIVAYYKNSDKTVNSYILPSTMGLFFDKNAGDEEPEVPDEPTTPTEKVMVDTNSKSAWEANGYGTDGYIILGSNSSKQKIGYSNLYTEYGNDGKTEIAWYRHGNSEFYYGEEGNGVDATAPIGKWAWLGQTWSWFNSLSSRNSYLYAPGTTTELPGRLHNTNEAPNKDTGFSFELRYGGGVYASVYVTDAQSEWKKVDYTANPITVSLYKTKTLFQATANDSNKAENITRLVDEYYGEAVAETTVTTNNVYVTFALDEPGVYTIVAYYKNSDKTVNSPIVPSTMGLFFDIYGEVGGGEGNEGDNEGGNEGGGTQPPVLPSIPAIASIDTATKSAWETAGFGKDGYFIFGRNQDGGYATYSNMYTEQGKDGKTEISLYRHGDNTYYYSYDKEMGEGVSVDETAPISKLIINGSSQWKAPSNSVNHLYIPGTQTTYPLALYNNVFGLYNDLGIGFTLRPASKTYVTVYVMDRAEKVSESVPITVALYNKMQVTTLYGYGSNTAETIEEHYGTPLAKVAVTENGTYVTFEIDGGGDYQIVAYYDNQGSSNSPVQPMMTGLFFDYAKGELANLTYELNGGENGPNPKTYVIGKGSRLSDAFKEDYTFDGWFTDSEYTNQITEISAEQTGALTLYAKFTRKYLEYTIRYETDGGEHPNTPASYVWGVGTALTDATKEGYTFVGWYYDNEYFLERAIEISAEQKGDITLYARFVKNPTISNITYEVDGGTHANPATYTEGEMMDLADAAKEGYSFLGWYTDSEYTNQITEISAEQTGDITLYAKFAKIPQNFAITYVVDGGTHYNPASYTEGIAVVLSDAIKAGYTFDGWYTESDFTNQITEISAEQTGDITLYAKFTEIVVIPPEDDSEQGSDESSEESSEEESDESFEESSEVESDENSEENSAVEPDQSSEKEPVQSSEKNSEAEDDQNISFGCGSSASIVGVAGALLAVGALLAKKKED